jgi:Protein of unknown function (DUF3465)
VTIKKLAVLAVILVASWQAWRHLPGSESENNSISSSDAVAASAQPTTGASDAAAAAFRAHASGTVISVTGVVQRVLADDRDGSPHQRFVLRTPAGQTLLVAHNLDLAPRLENLGVGEILNIKGEYVWNEQGGLLHWTHRDPGGNHPPGFIERNGHRYE